MKKKIKIFSRKAVSTTLYFQTLSFFVPIVYVFLFGLNLQTFLLSILASSWANFCIALKTKRFFGFKLNKKALMKLGIYILIISFLVFYQLYFFGSSRIVLASSCPTTAYCPNTYACLTECGDYYYTGTTCYYDADYYCCAQTRTAPDTCGSTKTGGPGNCRYAGKCTLKCSGVGTSCCPDQNTYVTNVQCLSTGCSFTQYDRDSYQQGCEATDSGCTPYIWMGGHNYYTGSGYRCCGDDGTNDDFAGYNDNLQTGTYTICDRCLDGNDMGWTYICGNGFFSSSSSSCSLADKTTATQGYCFYGDMTCTPSSAQSGEVSGLLYGNGYATGSKTSSTSITCYYGNINCGDGSYSNGASNVCYGNGYLSGSGTSRTCYFGDITGCTDEVPCSNGQSTTIYGWGYTPDNPSTSKTGTCYYGAGSCGDGSYSNGTSVTVYGNGYWTGTTCYYGDWSCGDGSYSNGNSASLPCSANNSQCCPNQGQRTEGVSCSDGSYSTGTAYDRDSSQARCQDGTSPGCSAKTWLGSNSTPGGPCCGDDGSTDMFENTGSGNPACVFGNPVNHNNIDSTARYVAFNGELYYCKQAGGSGSGYTFVQDVNPRSAVGSWKCGQDGIWRGGTLIGIRGGRIRIV